MTQKDNQKLRIGIVGAGSIVRARHLPALKKHPEVEIVAVSNSTYESSEKFCRENLPHATPLRNWPELVTMLCPPPMGMRADLLVKNILAENYIGRPHHVRLQSFTSNYLDPDAPPHWRQRIEISGLNVLTLGIYVEVLQRWLGDITGVFARGKGIHLNRQGYKVIIP